MLRQEIADKEELAELSQNEMEIAKQREIEQKDEIIQKIRSQLLKARDDQDEIDELRTKGIKSKIWPFFFENFVKVFNSFFQICATFNIFLIVLKFIFSGPAGESTTRVNSIA